MPARFSPAVAIAGPVMLVLSFVLTACDQHPTAPRPNLAGPFFQQVSLPDFQNHLVAGPARVEVRLIPGTLTARRVDIEEPQEMSHPEEIRSGVTAVSATSDHGTLTLTLGGLKIAFNAMTRFRPNAGDANQHDEALADFVARVQAQLAAGRHPIVKARRSPPPQPQAPGDASFLASEIKLDEGNNHPLLKLNVTGANLITTNQTPPVDATLKVLGLGIALRVSDGTTRLQVETPRPEGVQEFEGIAQSVDQTAKTVTLRDGTVIRIVAGTEIEAKDGDADEHLTSLAAVQAAVAAGQTVEVEGKGLVDSTKPLTLDAIEIEFEVEKPAK